jgi:alpha-glucosidase
VLSNHDVTRPVTRYGRHDTSFSFAAKRAATATDLALGYRRARAAALLAMALPGSFYLYQGDELGLPEVEDIPQELLQDPMYFRSGGLDPGRDGCRVPLPWSGAVPPYGFSARDDSDGDGHDQPTWLPQPADWAALTVEAQSRDDSSMLTLYRRALAIRRSEPALGTSGFSWTTDQQQLLSFRRGRDFGCVVNLGPGTVALPDNQGVLLSSLPLDDGGLSCDAAAWLRLPAID